MLAELHRNTFRQNVIFRLFITISFPHNDSTVVSLLQIYKTAFLSSKFCFASSAVRPQTIALKSCYICNSFLHPSYWLSFKAVSQSVCQIWTLYFSIFFRPSPILNTFRVTQTEKSLLETCFVHIMRHIKTQWVRYSFSYTSYKT